MTIRYALALYAALNVFACAHQERAEHAVINTEYAIALDRCKQQGKDARSYEVYEACAEALDMRLCNEIGQRCKVSP